ncbi:MAG: MMPL family transporter [Methanomassiliicoccales archaeon]
MSLVFENTFERLGAFSRKHSGKVILAWVVVLVILLPFAASFLGLTSYDLAKGIVSSNSMDVRATNTLSKYFPAAAPSSDQSNSTVVLTTGTQINDAAVISAYFGTQTLIEKFLAGQGVSGGVDSILTIEKSTLVNFSSEALPLLNGTGLLMQKLSGQLHSLNQTMSATVQLIYGIPSLFLENFARLNGVAPEAYNVTLQEVENDGALTTTYLASFYLFFNETPQTLSPPDRAASAIGEAVTNTTSPFYTATSNNTFLYTTELYVLENFSLSDFNLQSSQNMSHYMTLYENYARESVSPALASSNSTLQLLDALNLTPDAFVNITLELQQPASAHAILSDTAQLVSSALYEKLKYDPLLEVRGALLPGYFESLNGTTNVDAFVKLWMQYTGFSGYPVVPSAYIFHDFVGDDNSTTLIVISTTKALTVKQSTLLSEVVQSGFATVGGAKEYLAGSQAMSQQLSSQTIGGLTKALIIGIALSILIVGIFFRSVIAAFLPLAIFGVSALSAFSLNDLLYRYVIKSTVSFITPTLLLILLLGLSTDYVVYIMSRYRKEVQAGSQNPASRATRWAGHAVFTSGITVALSYIALWLSNVPLFSDSGISNALGVIVAIIAANTLLIAILHRGGNKIFWPYGLKKRGKSRMASVASHVVPKRHLILIVFVIVSLLSLALYAATPTNLNLFSLLPSGSGIKAVEIVNQTFHGDYFDQSFAVISFPSPLYLNGNYNVSEMAQLNAMETYLSHVPQISYVYGPTFPFGYYVPYNLSSIPTGYRDVYSKTMLQYIGTNSHYALITFQLSSLSWLPSTYNYVNTLPATLQKLSGEEAHVLVGGLAEGLSNAYSYTTSSFDRMLPILAVAIFAVLAIQLSSALTPVRLIAMVLASVVIALAITYLLFHYYLSIPLIIFLPMFTVITLLAVGLDYDIFMVSRVREEVLAGKSDEEGIRISMAENGAVIVTLGAILFTTFGALVFSNMEILEEIGVGLAFGVLIDTFVSWPFFVPSVMLVLRRLNWWPSRIGKNTISAHEDADPMKR